MIIYKTGKIWDCAKLCAKEIGINYGTFTDYLNGQIKKNKTTVIYLSEYVLGGI